MMVTNVHHITPYHNMNFWKALVGSCAQQRLALVNQQRTVIEELQQHARELLEKIPLAKNQAAWAASTVAHCISLFQKKCAYVEVIDCIWKNTKREAR